MGRASCHGVTSSGWAGSSGSASSGEKPPLGGRPSCSRLAGRRSVGADVVGADPAAAGDLHPFALRAHGRERLAGGQAADLAIPGARTRTDAQVRGRPVLGRTLHAGRAGALLVAADVRACGGAGGGAGHGPERPLVVRDLAAGQGAEHTADHGAGALAAARGVAVGDAVGLLRGGGGRQGGGRQQPEAGGGGEGDGDLVVPGRHGSAPVIELVDELHNARASLKAPGAEPSAVVHVRYRTRRSIRRPARPGPRPRSARWSSVGRRWPRTSRSGAPATGPAAPRRAPGTRPAAARSRDPCRPHRPRSGSFRRRWCRPAGPSAARPDPPAPPSPSRPAGDRPSWASRSPRSSSAPGPSAGPAAARFPASPPAGSGRNRPTAGPF